MEREGVGRRVKADAIKVTKLYRAMMLVYLLHSASVEKVEEGEWQ